jgi:outer membrane protein TolC
MIQKSTYRKMKKTSVGFLIGLLLINPGFNKVLAQTDQPGSRALTFEDAMGMAFKNNKSLTQSKNVILQKEEERKAAIGLFFPRINITATYLIMSDDIHLDLTQVRDAISPLYKTLGTYGVFSGVGGYSDAISTQYIRTQLLAGNDALLAANWDQVIQKKQFGVIAAGFTQPVFMGGKILLANQAARVKSKEASDQEKEKYEEIYSELIERYFGLVLNNHVVQVRHQVLATMNEHLNDAEKMKNEGIISNAEYLNAKVYYSEADRELKKSIHQGTIIKEALINTMAVSDSENILNPVSELFYLNDIGPLDSFIKSARSNSVLLQQIGKKQQLAKLNYRSELSGTVPQIAAMGAYNIADKDLSTYVPDYYVGVGLKWDLFQGTTQYHKIKAAKYQQEQANNYYDKASSDIETAINKYYNELNMNLEQVGALKTSLQFAEEYYRVRKKAFNEGMSTTTEVSDAELQVAKVKIEQCNAVYNYDLSLSRLLYYSGMIDRFNEYRQNASAEHPVF